LVLVPAMIVATVSACGRLSFDAVPLVGDDAPSDAPRPDAALPSMALVKKTDAPDWTPLTGPGLGLPYGMLVWEPSGPNFRFNVEAWGLVPGEAYTLIQYIDPWPGNPATDLAAATVDDTGYLAIAGSYELGRDLTTTTGKVWLVPSAFIDTAMDRMVAWDVTAIFFELDFVVYDDTDVP
jgi:hypothetical protein